MIRNSRRVVALAVAGAVAIAPVISGCGAGTEPQSAAPTQLAEGVNAWVPKNKPEAPEVDIRHMFLLGPKTGHALPSGAALPLYATLINQVKGRGDRLVSVSSPAFSGASIAGGAVTLPPAAPDGMGVAVQLVGKTGATASPSASPTKKKNATASPTGTASPSPTEEAATPAPTGQGATPSAEASPTSGNTPEAGTTPAATQAPGGNAPIVVLSGLNKRLIGGERIMVTLRFEKAGAVEVSVPVVPHQDEFATFTPVAPGIPLPTVSPATTPDTEGGHGAPTAEAPAGGGGH